MAGAACTRLRPWGSVLTCAEGMCTACNKSYHVPRRHFGADDAPSLSRVISVFYAADVWQLCTIYATDKHVVCYVLKGRHGVGIYMSR